MSDASLEHLANELFEQIVQHLNLSDICNLRLASRKTAFKAAQDTFRTYFQKKHVDLRRDSLESFVKLTSHSGVGCFVEDLSLVAVVYNPKDLRLLIETKVQPPKVGSSRKPRPCTPEEIETAEQDLAALLRRREEDEAFRKEGKDVVLLSQALSNIASARSGTLKRLSLRIGTDSGNSISFHNRRPFFVRPSLPVFLAATNTFWLMVECLRSTQLNVEALDIFHAWHEQLEGSLPCDNIGRLNLSPGIPLSTLRSLSISISDAIVAETNCEALEFDQQDQEYAAVFGSFEPPSSRDKIANEKNYSALSELLASSPRLEELIVVGYKLYCADRELNSLQDSLRCQYMHYPARVAPLTQLRQLCLACLEVNGADLITLLKNHNSSLRELDLAKMRISDGCFPQLVSYVTGNTTLLTAIRFDDLRAVGERIHFDCDWEREGLDPLDRTIVRRSGLERKADISYFGRGTALWGYALAWEWTLEPCYRKEEEEIDLITLQ